MKLRISEKSDMEGISALLQRCYPVLMRGSYSDDILATALPAMTRANPDLIATQRFYIVEEKEELVGCGGWSLDTPGTGIIIDGVAHIRHFAVDPQCTKKGVGQSIFHRCAHDARKAGASTFHAFSSLNAEPFYQKMGLKRVKQINVMMAGSVEFPTIFMEGPIKD